MTREEARHYLSVPSSTNGSGRCTDEQHYEAKQIAIKALEQEPCDDAVSRQAVINLIRGCNSALEEPRIFNCHNAGVKFEQYLTELPSVRPQEQIGHWSRKTKVDAYDIAGVKTWGIKCQCDRCDFTTIVVEDFGYYKYCPNCGAKMVEQKETETWHGIHAQITAPKGTFERIFNEEDDDYDI